MKTLNKNSRFKDRFPAPAKELRNCLQFKQNLKEIHSVNKNYKLVMEMASRSNSCTLAEPAVADR